MDKSFPGGTLRLSIDLIIMILCRLEGPLVVFLTFDVTVVTI